MITENNELKLTDEEKTLIENTARLSVKEDWEFWNKGIKNNIWIIERNACMAMIKAQKRKFFKSKSVDIYYSQDNPYALEINKSIDELL